MGLYESFCKTIGCSSGGGLVGRNVMKSKRRTETSDFRQVAILYFQGEWVAMLFGAGKLMSYSFHGFLRQSIVERCK